MGNTFVTLKEIARQALPRLVNNLVMPNLIHRDFSNDFRDLGDTIQVRRPVVYSAQDFNEANGIQYQDMAESTVDVKLDKIADVSAKASAIEAAVNIDDLNRIFVEPATVAIAEKINSEGLELYKDVYNIVGTAGTTPSTLANLAAVRKAMNVAKIPNTGRVAIWDPEADGSFMTLDAIVNAEKSASTKALREGEIGRIFGMDNYMSQSVKTHTKGTLAAGGTSAKITVKTAVTTASDTVVLDVTASASGTLTGTLKKGDILTIDSKKYVVTADATAADDEITVKVAPKITVAADTEVTVTANHTANLAFHPMAFAYVSRPLINPDGQGVQSYVTSYNGISLRVTKGYDMTYKRSIYSMDVLYGFKTIYPELAVRVMG